MTNTETNASVPATAEGIAAKAIAARQNSDAFSLALAELGFKVEKQVTRTVLQQTDQPIAVMFEGPAYEGEELQATKGSGAKMAPARLANVINLLTGEKQSLIMNTVLEGELLRAYGGKPDGEGADAPKYVGRSFAIRSSKPTDAEGKQKRYRVYQILELTKAEVSEDTGADVVADGSDPVARTGKKPKG